MPDLDSDGSRGDVLRQNGPRPRRRGSDGFTLIEVMLAILILSAILVPLSMAIMSSFRALFASDERGLSTVDSQRISYAWTRDVHNVDSDGVNAPGAVCLGASASSAVEQNLVSFSWDTASTVLAGTPTKTASWALVGVGEEMKIVRRYCEGGSPKSEQTLAYRVAKAGQTAPQVVSGYYGASDPTHSWSEFCAAVDPATAAAVANTCTFKITGAFKYTVSATRRVPNVTATAAPPSVPAKVVNVLAFGRNGYISTFWDAAAVPLNSPSVTGYRVYWYTDPSGSPIGAPVELSGVSNAATIPGLSNGTSYWVRVQAGNSIGWGELSDAAGPSAPASTAPDKPTITGVTPGDGKLNVSWAANGNDGGSSVLSWRIYAKPSSGAEIGPAIVNGGATASGEITGLTNGVTYTVTVTAVNALGEGQRSDPSANFVPYGLPGNTTIASVVRNDATGAFTITWSAPSTDGGRPITDYVIKCVACGPVGSTTSWAAADQVGVTSPTKVITGLSYGSNYTFRVNAANLAGTSLGNTSSPQVLARTIPGAPISPSVAANGAGAIKVSWSAAVANGDPVVDYRVTATPTVSGSPFTVSAAGALERNITGLTPGTSYTFTVEARNPAGYGPSATTGAVVATGQPGPPTAVTLSRPGGSFGRELTLGFTAPANTGGLPITSYAYTCTASGAPTVSGSRTSAGSGAVTGFKDGQDYTCSVTATNGQAVSTAGTSGAAESYGECTLKANVTNWVDSNDTGKNWKNSGQISVRRYVWLIADEKWAMVGFNFSQACTNGSVMPASAYVDTAQFGIWDSDGGTDRSHKIGPVTAANWADTKWSNRPAVGAEIGRWNDNGSSGRRSLNGVAATARSLKAGSITALAIQDAGSGSAVSYGSKYDGQAGTNKPELVMTFLSDGQ